MSTNATDHDVLIGCVQFSFVSFSVYTIQRQTRCSAAVDATEHLCTRGDDISYGSLLCSQIHNAILDHDKENTCIQNWRKPDGIIFQGCECNKE